MSIYAGLDVSGKTAHVCAVDAEEAVPRRDRLRRSSWHQAA